MMKLRVLIIVLLCTFWSGHVHGADPIVIPEVYDPSPVIDGSLLEWDNRGALREINTKAQATFNPDAWKGVKDLSGWVRFGHDQKDFLIAAHVVDSYFIQDQSGTGVWRGDHIMLTVDYIRGGKIDDVMQLGISPGSLSETGGTKPELVIWRPVGYSIEGARVAAKRTADGYDIEAAIPWKVFKIQPVKHQTFGLQLGLSDCDTTPTVQQKAMSISTAKWRARDPKRLTLAGLGDRAGNFPAGGFQTAQILAKSIKLKQNEKQQFTIDVKNIPEGMVPTLTFKARIDHTNAGGCSGPLRTTINGKSIAPKNIANRPPQMTAIGGSTLSAWYGAGVRLWFGPSYDSIEKSSYKPLDAISYDYTLRLDGMFEQGKNIIALQNVDKRPELVVIMDDVAFSWSPPSRFRKPKELKPAPTGTLTTYQPRTINKVDYKVAATLGGGIQLKWADRALIFESRFSQPGGKWLSLGHVASGEWQSMDLRYITKSNEKVAFAGKTNSLNMVRTFTTLDEGILIRDTMTNTSSKDLPVKIEHSTKPGAYEDLWLSGRSMPRKSGASGVAANPSVVVLGKKSGFAMMARDDIFRIHYRGTCNDKIAKLEDNSLVIKPGVTYQHEWLIFPLDTNQYWQYVNAARRHFDTNFAIPGSFSFYSYKTAPWKVVKEIEWAGAHYLSLGPQNYWKGMFPHGPFMKTLDQSKIIAMQQTIKAVSPKTKRLQYFNCYNRSTAKQKEDPDGWAADQARMPDGTQVTSGSTLTFYYPTLTNQWGKEMDQLVDWMLNTVGVDGLYWDCYNYWNVTHYAEPWDGWTADIDSKTHEIKRKRSNLALIAWPWREKLTASLLNAGRPLVANGNPIFTSEYKYRFPRFVETADISSLSKAHLFTPIALGDHVTERNEVDSYRWMLNALDWGGVYYWYGQRPTRPSFTTVMFPFTPIELNSGYLIGEERILTNISGIFGWGDNSQFTVHIFDRTGRLTDKIKAPRIEKNGKAYAELRIPEGFAASIVRDRD